MQCNQFWIEQLFINILIYIFIYDAISQNNHEMCDFGAVMWMANGAFSADIDFEPQKYIVKLKNNETIGK